MRGYNETKLLALEYLAEKGPATSREVASFLGISHLGASSYLRKLHDMGLLGRRPAKEPVGPSREKLYYVLEKGRERLDWLREVQEEEAFVPSWNGDGDVFKPRWE